MYTNVLRAIIRLSTLVFPENLTPSEIDALARSSVWDSHTDYPQITGHGIGQFLSVKECMSKFEGKNKKIALKLPFLEANKCVDIRFVAKESVTVDRINHFVATKFIFENVDVK